MRKDLGLHAFKIKLTQEIIFSDEAHFWLNGFVNKQNMRYWSATNPNANATPLHAQKVTVWCGFHAGV